LSRGGVAGVNWVHCLTVWITVVYRIENMTLAGVEKEYRRAKVNVGSNDAVVGRHLESAIVFHRNFWIVLIALHHVSHRHQLRINIATRVK